MTPMCMLTSMLGLSLRLYVRRTIYIYTYVRIHTGNGHVIQTLPTDRAIDKLDRAHPSER